MTRRLVLAAQTLATTEDFTMRVAASARAGFDAIGLRPSDYLRARERGASDAGLREILDEHGVRVAELSVLHDFAASGERLRRSRREEETLLRMADALGGDYLMAVGEVERSAEEAAERFAGVCDRAWAFGLQVALEYLPWTSVPDAATAWGIVRLAGRPNGGVLVDAWHHFRGARDDAQLLAIPPERIVAVQIDDAEAEPVGTLLEDTLHRRRVPGDGAFPLAEFVRLLDDHGVNAPFSVEVLSDELHAMAPAEAACRSIEGTRRVLAAAEDRQLARGSQRPSTGR